MRRLGSRLAAALLLLGVASCEVIINGDLTSVHCEAEGTVGKPACPDGFACTAGTCVAAPPVASRLGQPCVTDGDCGDSGICFFPARYGENRLNTCSRACCTSADCSGADGFVCWVPPGGGGNYCRLAMDIGRMQTGDKLAGETCGGDGDCRSGLCADGICYDACCSDTNCAAVGAICSLSGIAPVNESGWSCSKSAMVKKKLYDTCVDNTDCESGLCTTIGKVLRCSGPCCSSKQCGQAPEGPVACVDFDANGTSVRACALVIGTTATSAVGESCVSPDDCRGSQCVESGSGSGYCSDACCEDADCGDPAKFRCAPHQFSDAWSLRCELK